MEDLEAIGLLKVDFLGLSTLTIMRRACDLIRQRHGVSLDLDSIPLDDPAIYRLLSSGDVMGVFQVEGAGFRRVLQDMRPTRYNHIVAALALYRPGPMEYIPTYIRRMHGEEKVEYRHPALAPILDETYGIIVYQEQIIRIATDLAGYEPGEADTIRKAVGKKKKDALLAHRVKFVEGCVARGIPREVAEGIFDDIEFFARYGFNKAHAAGYAMVTCQTAYLKAHYPLEYMTALLTVERHNTEKVGILVNECRRMGIEVLPPSVNRSDLDFTIEGKAIRFGLGAVKNVGDGPVGAILAARGRRPFSSLTDFCRRVDLRLVNRRALESLIRAGALDEFGPRARLLAAMDRMMDLSARTHQARDVGQLSLFGEATGIRMENDDDLFVGLPPVPEVPLREMLEWEKGPDGGLPLRASPDPRRTRTGGRHQCLRGPVTGGAARVRRHRRRDGPARPAPHDEGRQGDGLCHAGGPVRGLRRGRLPARLGGEPGEVAAGGAGGGLRQSGRPPGAAEPDLPVGQDAGGGDPPARFGDGDAAGVRPRVRGLAGGGDAGGGADRRPAQPDGPDYYPAQRRQRAGLPPPLRRPRTADGLPRGGPVHLPAAGRGQRR
jgi:hypothetical protein